MEGILGESMLRTDSDQKDETDEKGESVRFEKENCVTRTMQRKSQVEQRGSAMLALDRSGPPVSPDSGFHFVVLRLGAARSSDG